MVKTHILLNNGVQMPICGFGTYRTSGAEVKRAITWAIETGVRLIDTASIYKVG